MLASAATLASAVWDALAQRDGAPAPEGGAREGGAVGGLAVTGKMRLGAVMRAVRSITEMGTSASKAAGITAQQATDSSRLISPSRLLVSSRLITTADLDRPRLTFPSAPLSSRELL